MKTGQSKGCSWGVVPASSLSGVADIRGLLLSLRLLRREACSLPQPSSWLGVSSCQREPAPTSNSPFRLGVWSSSAELSSCGGDVYVRAYVCPAGDVHQWRHNVTAFMRVSSSREPPHWSNQQMTSSIHSREETAETETVSKNTDLAWLQRPKY